MLKIRREKDEKIIEYYKDIPIDFKRDGFLMRRKIAEYLPVMTITNLSNLLLVSVDGIVVGNILGKDAFASVNIFGPVISLIGAITALASTGISTSLARAIGSNKQEEINRVRGASFQFIIFMAIFMSIIQFPLVKLIIDSYKLSPEMSKLVWEYATGIMICTPLGLVSAVGVYQLQTIGKMKIIMRLSVMEGISNLILNLLFVGALNLGVAGAGYGTACSNLLRATATAIYISRYTNIYKSDGYKANIKDFIEIIRTGMPEFTYLLITTIQAYCMMKILLAAYGTDGGVMKGVAAFCLSLTNVLAGGLQSSMRPLVGLLSGADDKVGLSELMESGFRLCALGGSACILVVMLFPTFFYSVNGINEIPDGGIEALRIFSLFFLAKGFNVLIDLYLANQKDTVFVSRLNIIGYSLLPAIAFAIFKMAPGPWLWFSYVITESIISVVLYLRYRWWKNKDIQEDYGSEENLALYMTVTPDKAVTASKAIREFAGNHEIDSKIANNVSLCMEEMVAYADSTKDSNKFRQHIKEKIYKIGDDLNIPIGRFSVQTMVKFKGKDKAKFTMLDDGHQIKLDASEEERKLTTNNYELIKRLAKSFEYQYILDMNYVTIEF